MSEHVSPAPTGRTTVHVTLNKPVDIETLARIFTGIGAIHGCRTCGLLGVDVRLSGDHGDPADVASIPGVKSVTLG